MSKPSTGGYPDNMHLSVGRATTVCSTWSKQRRPVASRSEAGASIVPQDNLSVAARLNRRVECSLFRAR